VYDALTTVVIAIVVYVTAGEKDVARRVELELSNYLPFLVNRVGVAIVEGFTAEQLKKEGLTIYTWRVLAVLASGGPQRQVDLVEMTSVDAPTISRVVSRLVHDGLVTRRRSTTSNREVEVALTHEGSAAVRRLTPNALHWEERALRGFSSSEAATVKRLLVRMYENLTAER